jgi:hypothetical protein
LFHCRPGLGRLKCGRLRLKEIASLAARQTTGLV